MANKIKLRRPSGKQKKGKRAGGRPGGTSQSDILQQARAHHHAGRFQQAESLYRQILAAEPTNPEALHFLGVLAFQIGRSDAAVDLIGKALSVSPDYVEAHNSLGSVLYDRGMLDASAASYRRALALKPAYAEAHYNLGITLYAQGKLEDAIASYRRALSLKPDHVGAHYNLGLALKDQGKLEEAAASYRRALALKPDYAEACHNLAVVFSELGRMDDAVACYRKTLSLNPGYIRAYKGLAALAKYTEVDDVVQAMEALHAKREEMPVAARIDLGFALGKICEDRGEYDRSFRFISEANRLKRQTYPYSLQTERDFFEKIKKTFSPDFLASFNGAGCQDGTPLFILGMPRSGTTLVEQILASHPQVFGAGELMVLINLVNGLCRGGPKAQFPECVLEFDADAFERLGAVYVAKIREYSRDTQYITDKMPNNFLYLGLIRTILPEAKVIHCMRDPMDTCFSIFKNDFTGRFPYAYDMRELGQYYNLYRDLMAYWDKAMPGFVFTVRYEDLVSEQRRQTENLLDFCGLPWDEACLDFHKTERRVSTASAAQVRQPIFKDSLALWKRYEKQLEPLQQAISGEDRFPQ